MNRLTPQKILTLDKFIVFFCFSIGIWYFYKNKLKQVKYITKITFTIVLISLGLFISEEIFAQGPPPPPPPPPNTALPIDGGISLLIAAGVGYGAKKIYDHNKKVK